MKILEVLKEANLSSDCNGQDIVGDIYYKYKILDFNNPIVVTFPPNRECINNDANVSPFNFDFLHQFDVNILCFGVLGAHNDNYFMNPIFSHFIENLGVALERFKLRLGYANSKGGFGIGAYAKALHLDHAILFHPISTKNIDLVPWDTRGSTKSVQHLDWSGPYGDVNLGDCKGYIIYDPENEIDVKHASRFHNFKHIKIYGYGHGEGYYFLSSHSTLIKEILRDFLYTQSVNISNIREKSKLIRLTSHYYNQLLNRKPHNKILLKSKIKLQKILSSPLIEKSPHHKCNIDTIITSAVALEKIDLVKALSLMEVALKLSPAQPSIKKKINEYNKNLKESIFKKQKEVIYRSLMSKNGNILCFDFIKNKCIHVDESEYISDHLSPVILQISNLKYVKFFTVISDIGLTSLFLSTQGVVRKAENGFNHQSEIISTDDGFCLIQNRDYFLSAAPSGKIFTHKEAAKNWERFTIEELNMLIESPVKN